MDVITNNRTAIIKQIISKSNAEHPRLQWELTMKNPDVPNTVIIYFKTKQEAEKEGKKFINEKTNTSIL